MPLSSDQAMHLCRRAGFGGTNNEISLFTGMERAAAVDLIVDAAPGAPSAPPGISNPDWWEVVAPMQQWWMQRMVDARWNNRSSSTPSPLEEKMALFWHSHFASGISKIEDFRAVWAQHKILRNRGMGSFQTLLNKVCTNGAILRYLDNNENTKYDPQENFARELMELYTIGPDEFNESDVVEMARAWTGHGIVGWTGDRHNAAYVYYGSEHDNGNKSLFGQPAQNWNGPDVLPMFTSGIKRDACATFLATKLWRFFVNNEPTAGEVQDIVNALVPGLHIGEALRAILMHDSFWAASNQFALTRGPIEFVVDVLGRLNLPADNAGLSYQLEELGQVLFEPPSVAGWGTGEFWISTNSSWGRAAWLSSLRWNENVHSQFDHLIDENDAGDAAAEIISILGIPSASSATVNALKAFWQGHQTRDSWALKHNAVIVGAMMPELHVA